MDFGGNVDYRSADFGYADDALPYTDSISEVNYISKSDFKSIV